MVYGRGILCIIVRQCRLWAPIPQCSRLMCPLYLSLSLSLSLFFPLNLFSLALALTFTMYAFVCHLIHFYSSLIVYVHLSFRSLYVSNDELNHNFVYIPYEWFLNQNPFQLNWNCFFFHGWYPIETILKTGCSSSCYYMFDNGGKPQQTVSQLNAVNRIHPFFCLFICTIIIIIINILYYIYSIHFISPICPTFLWPPPQHFWAHQQMYERPSKAIKWSIVGQLTYKKTK